MQPIKSGMMVKLVDRPVGGGGTASHTVDPITAVSSSTDGMIDGTDEISILARGGATA